MVTISIDELVKALEVERDKAFAFMMANKEFGIKNDRMETAVRCYNKAILLAKGMKRYEVK